MDQDRFDRIAKSLATPGSRRRVLGGLLGGALGGLLARLGPEEAGATHAGCRHTGATCTRPGQCCSGRCAGNNTCQLCTGASQCPEPPASAPCKKRACTSAGKCVLKNKAAGTACPDDGNECTDDVCDASGECTHPPRIAGTPCASDGNPCTRDVCNETGACTHLREANGTECAEGKACCGGACQSGGCVTCNAQNCAGCCDGTTCKPGGDCACPALQDDCTDAGQCTQGCEGAVACGPIGNLGRDQCCRPLGAPCSTPGDFGECCTVVEGGNLVYCGANHTCGGPGAQCSSSSTCASGVCCGFPGMGEEVCCAAGQQCDEDFQCTG